MDNRMGFWFTVLVLSLVAMFMWSCGWFDPQVQQDHIRTARELQEHWARVRIIIGYSIAVAMALTALLFPVTIYLLVRRRTSIYKPHHGTFPIIVRERISWWRRWFRGETGRIEVVNPNQQMAPVASHRFLHDGRMVSDASTDGFTREQLARAHGDNTRVRVVDAGTQVGGGNKMNAAMGKYLAGAYDPKDKPRAALPEPEEPVEPTRPYTWVDSINESKDGQIILGQARSTGALAVWDTNDAMQLGIFGANGTGKTASTGMQVVTAAVKAGWHVIVLDPKRGADWGMFGDVIEHHYSGPEDMGPQLAEVVAEMNRRAQLLQAAGVGHVNALPKNQRPVDWMLVLEEFGDTRLVAGGLGLQSTIDTPVDSLMRMSRFTGLRIVIIDQRPDDWPKAMKANLKATVVFKMGMHQGNSVGYFYAHELANKGEFAWNGERYIAWHAAEYVAPAMQQNVAAGKVAPVKNYMIKYRVQGVSTQQAQAQAQPQSAPVGQPVYAEPEDGQHRPLTKSEIREQVFAYLDDNYPNASQAEMRERWGISNAYAHRLWHAWLGETDA